MYGIVSGVGIVVVLYLEFDVVCVGLVGSVK